MKKFNFLMLLVCSMTIFASCSSDDGGDSSNNTSEGPVFKINEDIYDIGLSMSNTAIISYISPEITGVSLAQINLTGIKGNSIGSVTFLIRYNPSSGISGNYVFGDSSQSVGVFDGGGSQYFISDISMNPFPNVFSTAASGNLEILNISGDKYYIKFNVQYEDGSQATASFEHVFVVED